MTWYFYNGSPMDVRNVAFPLLGHLKSSLGRAKSTGPGRDASPHLVDHAVRRLVGAGAGPVAPARPVRAACVGSAVTAWHVDAIDANLDAESAPPQPNPVLAGPK